MLGRRFNEAMLKIDSKGSRRNYCLDMKLDDGDMFVLITHVDDLITADYNLVAWRPMCLELQELVDFYKHLICNKALKLS